VDSDEEEGDEDADSIRAHDGESQQLPDISEQDEEPQRPVSEPITPKTKYDTSEPATPIFKFTRYEDALADPSPMTENPWDISNPASASAIHPDISELPVKGDQPPPIHATTSAPVLPTLSTQVQRPQNLTRYTGPASPALGRPRTPDQQLEPHTPLTPLFGSVGRHSIVGLFPEPGALTNPLSGSLSAIVMDNLRRGVDVSVLKQRSLRSKRSRKLNVPESPGRPRNSVAEGADHARNPRRGASESLLSGQAVRPDVARTASGTSPMGRVRSMSATLTDLVKGGKTSRRDTLESDQQESR